MYLLDEIASNLLYVVKRLTIISAYVVLIILLLITIISLIRLIKGGITKENLDD